VTGASGILPNIGASGFVPPVTNGRLTEVGAGAETVRTRSSSAEAGGSAERGAYPEPCIVGAEDTTLSGLSGDTILAAGRGSDGALTSCAGRRS
jgi:hypothetical protein